METVITIDAEVLDKAMKIANGQTPREIVEDALRLFAMQSSYDLARQYRGKLQWEGDLDQMRTSKWSS